MLSAWAAAVLDPETELTIADEAITSVAITFQRELDSDNRTTLFAFGHTESPAKLAPVGTVEDRPSGYDALPAALKKAAGRP